MSSWKEDTIPKKVAKAMTDVMAGFDFEKASTILTSLNPSDADKYRVEELKDFVVDEMWRIYEQSIEEGLDEYYSSGAWFRIEYNNGNFRVALEVVEWDTGI